MNGAQIDSMRTGPTYERNASVKFVDRIRRSPERTPLVVLGEDVISYEALGERLAATVHAPTASGAEHDERVAFAAWNRPEVPTYMAATLHLGCHFQTTISRPLASDPRLTPLHSTSQV